VESDRHTEEMLENIPTMVMSEENSFLMNPIEESEIKNAIWSLDTDKAWGLMVFYVSFYRGLLGSYKI
jgi:hypothetical protein